MAIKFLHDGHYTGSNSDLTIDGTLTVGSNTVIDTARRGYFASIQHSSRISFLNGSQGTTGSGAQAIAVSSVLASGTYNINPGSGDVWATSDMRAPIYYDIDNITYYVDPNSQSVLDKLQVKGRILHGLTSTSFDNPKTEIAGFIAVPGPETTNNFVLPGITENKLAGAHIRSGYTVSVTKDGSTLNNNLANAFLANDGFASISSTTSTTVVVITISHPGFTHGSNFGITFSNPAWRAKDVKIERSTDSGSNYTTIYNVTDSARSAHIQYSSTGSTATNQIRITLTNFNTTSTRISHIIGNNYAGGAGYFPQLYADNTFLGDQTIQNVGSGDRTLTLSTTTGGDPTIVFNSAAANRSGLIRYQDNGTNIGRIEYVHNGDKLQFQAGSATGYALQLENSQATFGGSVTIGSDTNEKDFKVYGNDSGELLQWFGAHSKLRINHDTDDAGLEIFTVASAQPTSHQIKIGRDSNQYLGIRVDDGRSYFIHRQDESSAGDNHHQTNQIWTNGGGTHTWNWDIADNAGNSPSNKMQLNSSGNLTISGTLTTTGLTIGSDVTTSVGKAFLKLGDVTVASYVRVNADETLSYLNASQFLNAIGGVDGSAYLPLSGGTMTGDLTTSGNIILSGSANEIIKSNGSIRLNIDSDNNQGDRVFIVSHHSNSELFRVDEGGHGTFQGNVTASSFVAPNVYAQNLYITSSGTSAVNRIDNDTSSLYITYGGTSNRALEISNSDGNASFSGLITATKTQNAQSLFSFKNLSTGTAATSRVVAEADGGSVQLVAGGSNYAAVGGAFQDAGVVLTDSMSGGLILASDNGVAINANGGTRALTISASDQSATFEGDVNIGNTTSSSTVLNLIKSTSGVSEIKFLNVSNEKASIQLDAAEDLHIFANTSQQIKLRSGGADTLTLDSSQNATFASSVTAGSFVKSGGTSSQFLMADGSVSTGGGTIDGSGTAGRLAKWSDSDTLTSSGIADASNAVAITINGNEEVGIGGSPFSTLDVYGNTVMRANDGNLTLRSLDTGTKAPNIRFNISGTDVSDLALHNNTTGIATNTLVYSVGGSAKVNFFSDGNVSNVGHTTSTKFRDASDTTYYLDPNSNSVLNQVSFGVPGNGQNNKSRFFSIEGNADGSGEGSSRIFFTEHNSTTAAMSNYGMSLGYRGGNTSITGTDGNSWTGLSLIGNGQWGMWGHDNSAQGALIMYGDRAGTFINFDGNNLSSIGTAHGSTSNFSGYQLNGTFVMDSSRNLVNIGTITASGVVNIANNLSLTGDSRILNLAGGSTTNSQSRLIIGEQGVYGVSFRWDSGSNLEFDGFWNSSVIGSRNRDLGSVDVNNRIWNFNNTVVVGDSVTATAFYDSSTAYYFDGNNTTTSISARGDIIIDKQFMGTSKNFADMSGWTTGTGTKTGYFGGDFGSDSQGNVKYDKGPFGQRQLIQETVPDSGNDYDGGWNKRITNLDINKPHISIVYVKRITSQTSGNFYHGTGAGANEIVNVSDGASNGNPYFVATGVSNLPQDVWCVSIGHIMANNDSSTNTTNSSGVYRLDTGEKILSATTYKFGSNGSTLSTGHRTFLYYSSDNTTKLQFANPGFYEVNGNEPSLSEIVSRQNVSAVPTSGGTFTGPVTHSNNVFIDSGSHIQVDEIRDKSGQDLTITAGEAHQHLTQSTHNDEVIRLAAESGVKVYSSTDNLTSGLNKVTTLIDSSGHMSIASDLTVGGGDITLSGTGRIQGVDTVSAGTDAANKTYVDNSVSGLATADTTYEFNFSTQLSANTWTDTGIDGTDMATGTYIMRVEVSDHNLGGQHYDEAYSATISWFGGSTNSTMHDEIVIHRAGHAPNNGDIQFRTLRASGTDSHDLMLQVKHNMSYNAAPDQTSGKIFKFKFRKMI